jgi:hypothetical protein
MTVVKSMSELSNVVAPVALNSCIQRWIDTGLHGDPLEVFEQK